MIPTEYQPGERAPAAGDYEELNVFGSWTGKVALLAAGDPFPASARGFTWRPLAARSAAELRAHAAEYRRMAAAARTPEASHGLSRVAERLETLAAQRDQGDKPQPAPRDRRDTPPAGQRDRGDASQSE